MTAGIYLVTCTSNGTKYVGSSKNIPYRWWKHKSDLRLGRHENPRWQNTWNKYGADAFEWAVLEEVEDEKKLCEREQHWIDILHPELNVYPCADYNYMSEEERKTHAEKIANGQRNRWARLTPKEKKKISVSMSKAWKGEHKVSRTQSIRDALQKKHEVERLAKVQERQRKAEAKAQRKAERERKRLEWEAGREQRKIEANRKRSESQKGRLKPEAQKKKLRQAALKEWADPEYRAKHQAAVLEKMQDPEVLKRLSESHKGKKLSKEHRRKIGESGRGKKRSEETRRRLSEARKAWWARKKGER